MPRPLPPHHITEELRVVEPSPGYMVYYVCTYAKVQSMYLDPLSYLPDFFIGLQRQFLFTNILPLRYAVQI